MTITKRVSRFATLGLIAAMATALVAGCGGGSNGNGATQVRVVNAVVNGGSATLTATGLATQPPVPFGASTTYQNVNGGSDTFAFSLSAQPSITYSPINQNISDSSLNTAFLFGRGDITDTSDPRFPKLTVIQNDTTSPDINNTRIRAVHAAPDGPAFDVLVGSNQITPPNIGINYSTIEPYSEFGAGTYVIEVQQTGTTNIVAQAQYTLNAGGRYSITIIEPTTSTPTYGLQLSND